MAGHVLGGGIVEGHCRRQHQRGSSRQSPLKLDCTCTRTAGSPHAHKQTVSTPHAHKPTSQHFKGWVCQALAALLCNAPDLSVTACPGAA